MLHEETERIDATAKTTIATSAGRKPFSPHRKNDTLIIPRKVFSSLLKEPMFFRPSKWATQRRTHKYKIRDAQKNRIGKTYRHYKLENVFCACGDNRALTIFARSKTDRHATFWFSLRQNPLASVFLSSKNRGEALKNRGSPSRTWFPRPRCGGLHPVWKNVWAGAAFHHLSPPKVSSKLSPSKSSSWRKSKENIMMSTAETKIK